VFTNPNSYHGTHVAGIANGKHENGKGSSGIAPNCKLMPIQVGDKNGLITSTYIIDGILYAINQGANVINISLGMQTVDEVSNLSVNEQQEIINQTGKDEEAFWEEVYELANKKNVTIVLAGGNQNVLIGIDPMQRSNKTIKVSATNINNGKADFSNFGDYSTISAPGVHIMNCVPDNQFKFLDGTSMAAPIITGAVALMKSMNKNLTNQEIIYLLQSSGLQLNADIGNLVQLDKILEKVKNNDKNMDIDENPADNELGNGNNERAKGIDKNKCTDAQAKINKLKSEIDKVKATCPECF
jgi:subtilisin family serine protease